MNITVTVKGDKALTTAITNIGEALMTIAGGAVADEPTPEQLADASEEAKDEKPAPKPKAKTETKKTTAKKKAAPKEEAPADDGDEVDAEAVRLKLKEYAQTTSNDKAIALLKKHGGTSFSTLPTDAIAALAADLDAAMSDDDGGEEESESSFLD